MLHEVDLAEQVQRGLEVRILGENRLDVHAGLAVLAGRIVLTGVLHALGEILAHFAVIIGKVMRDARRRRLDRRMLLQIANPLEQFLDLGPERRRCVDIAACCADALLGLLVGLEVGLLKGHAVVGLGQALLRLADQAVRGLLVLEEVDRLVELLAGEAPAAVLEGALAFRERLAAVVVEHLAAQLLKQGNFGEALLKRIDGRVARGGSGRFVIFVILVKANVIVIVLREDVLVIIIVIVVKADVVVIVLHKAGVVFHKSVVFFNLLVVF